MNKGVRHARGAKHAGSIVVVDDEVASGELIAALLRSQGYGVRLLTEGRAALELVKGGSVDLLVLDLMMAKLDGAEVCAMVRTELRELTLPIVIVTSLQDRESRIRAKEAGADDVLLKPIDALELLVRIETLLRTRAHVIELSRDRARLQVELELQTAKLAARECTLRSWESDRGALQHLFGEQREILGSVRERASEAAEWIPRLLELDAKVRRVLERTSEANAGVAAAGPDQEESGPSAESCSSPASAAK